MNRVQMRVSRLNNADSSVHYLEGNEIMARRKLRRDYPKTDFFLESERKKSLKTSAVSKMVVIPGNEAKIELSVYPHMLLIS